MQTYAEQFCWTILLQATGFIDKRSLCCFQYTHTHNRQVWCRPSSTWHRTLWAATTSTSCSPSGSLVQDLTVARMLPAQGESVVEWDHPCTPLGQIHHLYWLWINVNPVLHPVPFYLPFNLWKLESESQWVWCSVQIFVLGTLLCIHYCITIVPPGTSSQCWAPCLAWYSLRQMTTSSLSRMRTTCALSPSGT